MASIVDRLLHDTTPAKWSDLPSIAVTYISAIVFWSLSYYAFNSYMHSSMQRDNKHFHALTPEKKADYLSRLPAGLHALFASTAAIIFLLFTCEDGKSMITSDKCLVEPSMMGRYWVLVSGGYFVYDFVICIFFM